MAKIYKFLYLSIFFFDPCFPGVVPKPSCEAAPKEAQLTHRWVCPRGLISQGTRVPIRTCRGSQEQPTSCLVQLAQLSRPAASAAGFVLQSSVVSAVSSRLHSGLLRPNTSHEPRCPPVWCPLPHGSLLQLLPVGDSELIPVPVELQPLRLPVLRDHPFHL